MTAAAWKASAGAAARVPVARATNLTRALEAYRKAGLRRGRPGRRTATSTCADLEVAVDPLVRRRRLRGQGPVAAGRARRATCVVRIPMHAGDRVAQRRRRCGRSSLHAVAARAEPSAAAAPRQARPLRQTGAPRT